MHYILNTVFRTPGGVTQTSQIGGPTRFGQQQPVNNVLIPRELKPGELYTLIYIKKLDEKVQYMFKGSKGQMVNIEFDDCLEADKFIAKMRNESLPDYNKVYSKNKT